MRLFGVLLLTLCINWNCFSQTISVNDDYANELARVHQLLGGVDSITSFTVRPLNLTGDSLLSKLVSGKNLLHPVNGRPSVLSIQLLPFNWLNDFNLNRPYGYNDGSLYPARGYQTRVSGGLYVKAGVLVLQLAPEIVYAQNENFATFNNVQAGNNDKQLISSYFGIVNGIDAPERFGTAPLTHLYWGQSKLTVNFKDIELGLSTENLWWGPGIQNSIMMSNSAPGFLHWTVNSVKPMKTFLGSFEWQIIGGELKESGYRPDTAGLANAANYYTAKPVVTRYISAFTINWHPKWVDGFFVGASAYDYMNIDSTYHKWSTIHKLVPVFIGSSVKDNAITSTNNGDGQDLAIALNFRQVFVKYKAEIYAEWARNDWSASLNDFLQDPEHSAAYTIGGRKLFDLLNGAFLQFKTELTHLERDPSYLVRNDPMWYVHGVAPQDGYTNQGRYVGAGIGPGSNSLMWDIGYLKGMCTFGMTIERLVHDNDLYNVAFENTGVYNQHWVDLSDTFYSRVKIKNYLVSAELTPVYTLNYEYKSGSSYNLHTQLNLTYYFD